MKTIIYTSLIVLGSLHVHAQQVLTPEAYRARVEAASEQLQQQEWRIVAATEARKVAHTALLPQIDIKLEGSANLNHLDAWHAPQGSYHPYTYQALASLNWSLYQGGNLMAQQEMARANESMQMLSKESLQEEVDYQSDVCYWQAAAARALLDAAEAYQAIVNEQQALVEARFRQGAIPRTDLLMINTRSKEVALQVEQAEEYCKLCLIRLNILMNEAPDAAVDSLLPIDAPEPTIVPLSLQDVLPLRADYQSSFVTLSQRKAARKQALSSYRPQLNLFLASGWDTGTSYLGTDVEHTPIIGLKASIPLIRWGAYAQTKRREHALTAIEQLSQSELQQSIGQELAEVTTSLQSSTRQVRSALQALLLARQNLHLISFSYNEGACSMSDVLTAQMAWTSAQSNLIQAQLTKKLTTARYRRVVSQ